MPGSPAPFELPVSILDSDIDEVGHVNNITYVRWVQEAAVAHWQAEAPAEDQASLFWVVLRHEIDYLKEALPPDILRARTWVGQATRLRFVRHTEIFRPADDAVLARALTYWCPIDVATRRPVPVSPTVRSLFSTR